MILKCWASFTLVLLLASPNLFAGSKELTGSISGINPGGNATELVIVGEKQAKDSVQILPDTKMTRQIRFEDIREGEFAAVIFEERGGKSVALSTTVGSKEQVEKQQKSSGALAVPQETMKAPQAPQMPEMPAMPPLPGAENAPPQAQGPGGKSAEEASGFTPEEEAKAKQAAEKPKGILSPENPLSPAEKEAALPPNFVSGKVVSTESAEGKGKLVLEKSPGARISLDVNPQLQVVNRILELPELEAGSAVTVFYEQKEEVKLARSIVLAPAPKR